MKRVLLTIKPGSPGRVLPIFATAEAAYIWRVEAYNDPTVIKRVGDVDEVTLHVSDSAYVEWMGCEITNDIRNHIIVDNIRLVKVNASGDIVSTHSGWTVDCIVPFKDFSDNDINVAVLKSNEGIDVSDAFEVSDY